MEVTGTIQNDKVKHPTSRPMDPLVGILIEPVRSSRVSGVSGLMPSSSKLFILRDASRPKRSELERLMRMSSTRSELERPRTYPVGGDMGT